MAAAASWMVLFDIDGTLIQTGRAGLRGMNAAFRRLYGTDDALRGIRFAGRTDRAIVGDALRGIGREATPAEIARLREAYVDDLRVEIRRPVADPSGILPGVEALLAGLAGRADVAVGLLTGNFEEGAQVKLGHFGLWRPFRFGAFGDDHDDRRALVPVALARARAVGIEPPPVDRVILVGDTPLDVDCARAAGARVVAVATGPFGRDALAAAGADVVVDSLEEAGALSAWLGVG